MARILIIEDNPTNLELMAYLLKAFGHTLFESSNGETGLEIAQNESLDLILCDMQLPQMDGFGVAQEIKKDPRLRTIPLIAVTAFAMVGDRDKMLSAGFDGYIPKPIDPETFVEQIQSFLGHNDSREQKAGRRLILVVDDYPSNRELVATILGYKGYSIIQAANGLEALDISRRQRPDLIIADILMPLVDGYEFVRQLRNEPEISNTMVIFYTSTYIERDARRLAEACGVTHVLLKPIEPQNLLEVVEEAFGEVPPPPAPLPPDSEFDREHLKLITNKLANQIAELETLNTQLQAEVAKREQRERELEAVAVVSAALTSAQTRGEMVPVILNQLDKLFKVDGSAIVTFDPLEDDVHIELAGGEFATKRNTESLAGAEITKHVLETGQPFMSNDAHNDPQLAGDGIPKKIKALACIPFIAQGQQVGALWVGKQGSFLDDEIPLLTSIGDIAANALHRVNLYEQTERRLQNIAALHEIDLAISSSLDLRFTLNVLLEQVTIQLGVDAADILLLNPLTNFLEYRAGRGFLSKNFSRPSLRIGESQASRAVLERRIIGFPDLSKASFKPTEKLVLPEDGFTAYYGVPLVAKGQVKGVLEIFHRKPLKPRADWLDFLDTLAGQAAIAIDDATLFSNLQKSNIELTMAYDATIEGWSHALDLRDKETEGHTQRVTELTLKLAQEANISETELVHIRRGSLLHDIGKMGIPDSILLKQGELTEEERKIMEMHPVYAYEMLSPIQYLGQALDIPYCHHEKWDGSGYPRGLKGEQIPLAARLFAIVDVWDALRYDRPYREAWPEEKTIGYIKSLSKSHFDPEVVEYFFRVLKSK